MKLSEMTAKHATCESVPSVSFLKGDPKVQSLVTTAMGWKRSKINPVQGAVLDGFSQVGFFYELRTVQISYGTGNF